MSSALRNRRTTTTTQQPTQAPQPQPQFIGQQPQFGSQYGQLSPNQFVPPATPNAQFNGQQLVQPPQLQRGTNLTPQQTFEIVFARLTSLEKKVENVKPTNQQEDDTTLNAIVEEFNSRTELLAGEIADLKNMLLKLQSYTLEVNQKLFLQQNQGDGFNQEDENQ
jgi:hypothetical protein